MKKEEIDILLSRFYEGMTTEKEELALRDFFTGSDVPAGYEAEKAFFSYIIAGKDIPEPETGFEDRIISALNEIPGHKRQSTRKIVLAFSGIAAGIVILIGSWFLFSRHATADTFSDPEIAYVETMKILYDVSAKMNSGAATLAPVSKMNITQVEGLKVLSRSTETVEKNLENLNYFQKVLGITNIEDEEKK